MRFIWEETDIKPGRVYGRAGMREQWLIGYRPELESKKNLVSVSLADGMVAGEPRTKMEMAEVLSRNDYAPIEFLSLMAQGKEAK